MALPHPEIFGFLSHDQLAQNYQAYRHDFERLVVAERVLAKMPRDAAHGNDYWMNPPPTDRSGELSAAA